MAFGEDCDMAVEGSLLVLGVNGLGEITAGDDLAALIAGHAPLVDGDVVYVPEGHKIDASAFFSGLVGALSGAYNVTHL